MATVTICAVLLGDVGLGAQTRPPDYVVRGLEGAAAAAGSADWLWLVGPGVQPGPASLEALLDVLGHADELGDPVLLAGKVVDVHGTLDVAAEPWPRLLARESAIAGALHAVAALRAARYGSLLVASRAVERHGLPRADFAGQGDDLEWTSRLLRDDAGYLVPASVATRTGPPPVAPAALAGARVRMLRGDSWGGQEKAWFGFRLAQDLVRETARRPAAAPALLRAIVSGLRARA